MLESRSLRGKRNHLTGIEFLMKMKHFPNSEPEASRDVAFSESHPNVVNHENKQKCNNF